MRRSVVFVVVVSMMLAGAVAAAAAPLSTHGGGFPVGALHTGSHTPCQGGETVLVIQDNVEWFVRPTDDQRGNVVSELIAQEKNWCAIHSNQLATADLTPFGEIIIPSAQNQGFYNNLFPGGTVDPNLNAWVLGGGVLSANLADHDSGPEGGGNWDDGVFVGGLQHVVRPLNNLNIVDAAHPIIMGTAPCPSGNCGAIVDTGALTDLDGWGDSAHGFFTNLPAGATVILEAVDTQPVQPVMIEYPHGNGIVVATLSTSEYMYAGDFGFLPRNKKLLSNEIAYQDSLLAPEVSPEFLLIDEDTIDNGTPDIEGISFSAPFCGGPVDGPGDPAVCVNDDLAAPGVRTPLFTRPRDVTPLAGLTLSTGQIGDEGLFRFTEPDPQTSLQNGATFTTAEFFTATGAVFDENNLDKIDGGAPLSEGEIVDLVGKTVCAVVYDSDISIDGAAWFANLKGATSGVTAFLVTAANPDPAGGSYLPLITVDLLPSSEVSQVCGLETGGNGE